MLGAGDHTELVELAQGLAPKSEVTTDASDTQKLAQLANAVDSLQAQARQIRQSAGNLQASERLRALEAVREQVIEAGRANAALTARLNKLETRLAQLERAALD